MGLTMQEIAKLAGVSKSTVSKVCRGSSEISPATAQRVRAIIDKNGYQPRSRHPHTPTRSIGLIIEHPSRYIFTNPFLCEVLVGICEVISKEGFSISFYWESDLNYSELYTNHLVDGILLLMPLYYDTRVKALLETGCPLVSIGEHSLKERIRYIDSDDASGTYNCVQYLYSQNHRRIAFIGGNPNLCSGINRLAGYRRGLADLGLEYDPSIVYTSSINLKEDGERMMNSLMGKQPKPTAVICFNDLVAVGAMQVIKQQGYRVPDDFSIIGFDDIELCEYVEPRLTSVCNIASRKGRDAARWLLDIIAYGSENVVSKPTLLPMNIILRDSTRPLPRQSAAQQSTPD